jgi:magnesium-transporting ATPase (P-type)
VLIQCNLRIFQRRQVMARAVANNDPSAMFDAESPDELALVKAAEAYGFLLVSRSSTDIRVRLPNTTTPSSPNHPTIFEDEIELEIMKVLPFDSDRKRMSIIVRLDDQLFLLCKGADEQVTEIIKTVLINFRLSPIWNLLSMIRN